MPHLTLEYTANVGQPVDSGTVFLQIHRMLAEVGGVKIAHCKSRSRAVENFFIAEGGENAGFVHLDLRLLAGRSVQLKQELGTAALKILEQHFSTALGKLELQITVSVIDIERETYFKIPKGTI